MKNFNLKSFKQDPNSGKWVASFEFEDAKGKKVFVKEMTFDRIPSSDLVQAMKPLGKLLGKANDLFVHRKDLKLKAADKKKVEAAEIGLSKMDELVLQSVKVSGISLKGTGDSKGVVIIGKREVHHTAVAMNSPFIHFNGDSFGFEAEVKEAVEAFAEEARLYIVEYKYNDGTLDLEEKKEKVAEVAA